MPDSLKDLPKGWIKTTIGDITIPKVKQGISADKNSIEYIDISSIDNKLKEIVSPKKIEKGKVPSRARQNVCQNDILVSMTRPNLNAVAKVPAELDGGIASTGFDVLRPILVEPNWLFSYVKSSVFVEAMTQKVQGALYPAVKSADVRSFEINLPPINEQNRISNKIESLQAKSKEVKKALEAAKPLLDKLRQSILASAFRGDLTADWRKKNPDVEPASVLLKRIRVERRKKWEENELAKMRAKGKEPKDDKWKSKYKVPESVDIKDLPELPESWCWARLEEISILKGGLTKGKKRKETDVLKSIPYLRVANVQRGYLDLKELSLIEATEIEVQDLKLQYDDILFNEGGDRDKLGRGWIWKDAVEECIHQNHVFRARLVSNEMISELISYFGNTFGQQWFMKEGKQSTNLASLNLTKLSNFPVPIIPYVEAKRIFKTINIHFERLESLQKLTSHSFKKVDVLNQSILNNAFQGKLVSQDPSDEPAALLFEHIQNGIRK